MSPQTATDSPKFPQEVGVGGLSLASSIQSDERFDCANAEAAAMRKTMVLNSVFMIGPRGRRSSVATAQPVPPGSKLSPRIPRISSRVATRGLF